MVGLWVSPDRLVQVRRNRLASMGEERDTDYIDLETVRAEITATRKLFEQHDWPPIDVSRRSIEETAAAVINLLTERRTRKRGHERLVLASASASRQMHAASRRRGFRGFCRRYRMKPALMPDLWAKGADAGGDRRRAGRAEGGDGVAPQSRARWCWAGIPSWLWERRLISKCRDLAALRALLLRLSGKSHQLISAAALARDGAVLWRHTGRARLTMRRFQRGFPGRLSGGGRRRRAFQRRRLSL